MQNTKNILTPEIEAYLPFNWIKLLQLDFNEKFSPSYISKVKTGRRYNPEIMTAILGLALKEKEKIEQTNNLAKEITFDY